MAKERPLRHETLNPAPKADSGPIWIRNRADPRPSRAPHTPRPDLWASPRSTSSYNLNKNGKPVPNRSSGSNEILNSSSSFSSTSSPSSGVNVGQTTSGSAAVKHAPPLRVFGLRLVHFKVLLFAVGLVPLLRWVVLGFNDALGANPIEFLTRSAGTFTFVCLLVTLSITPLRVITRQHALIHVRRMCGLFTFFYAFLHFLTYVWWDQWFNVDAIISDVLQRPFIALGFTAFLLLIPMAFTSTRGWMRRLGKRWQKLHRLVYAVALLALAHFWLHRAGKNDFFDVYIFGGVLVLLLGWRLMRAGQRRFGKR